MERIVARLNDVLADPTPKSVAALFEPESHIRLNNIFISPVTLVDLKALLDSFGLVSWEVVMNGLVINFEHTFIYFQGFYEVFVRSRLFSFELNFEPVTSSEEGRFLMQEIEVFLRRCDAMFFLTYPVDIDSVILRNSLGSAMPFLTRRFRSDTSRQY